MLPIACIGNSTDFSHSKVANKLRSSKIWYCLLNPWYNLRRKSIFSFDIMRNLLRAVVVKPSFCVTVFIVKNEATEILCLFDITKNLSKTMFVITRSHCIYWLVCSIIVHNGIHNFEYKTCAKTYSEPCQTSKIERFAKVVNRF